LIQLQCQNNEKEPQESNKQKEARFSKLSCSDAQPSVCLLKYFFSSKFEKLIKIKQ